MEYSIHNLIAIRILLIINYLCYSMIRRVHELFDETNFITYVQGQLIS